MRLILTLLFVFSLPLQAKVVEKILVVVNDEIITQSDIENYRQKLRKSTFNDDLILYEKSDLLNNSKLLLEHLIDQKIIDSEVKRLGLEVTVEKVDQEIRNIAKQNGITKPQLREALKKQGVSFAEYQDFMKSRLERQNLIQRVVTAQIKISDEEVQNYYLNNNQNNSLKSYEYTLSHILFSVKETGEQGAKQRAEEVYKKISSGQNFEKLAAQYSEDPAFTAGGFLGKFKSGEFLKELENAAKKLEANQYSQPIKTKQGYHIIKVLEKKISSDPEFDRQKVKIREILYQKAFKNQFSFWLEQKRQSAFIRKNY